MVDRHVVDAGAGDGPGMAGEAGHPGAGHLERADLAVDSGDHGRGIDLEGGVDQAPVVQVVQVLVGCDPLHDLVAGPVGQHLGRVQVGDAGGQFLEGDVDERAHGAGRGGTLPVDTWHIRPRSSSMGSTMRVIVA